MIFHRCDYCGTTQENPMPITIVDRRAAHIEFLLSLDDKPKVEKLRRDIHLCSIECLRAFDIRPADLAAGFSKP